MVVDQGIVGNEVLLSKIDCKISFLIVTLSDSNKFILKQLNY